MALYRFPRVFIHSFLILGAFHPITIPVFSAPASAVSEGATMVGENLAIYAKPPATP
ncbi:hypothetical protein PtB15_15B320 [Puccinia triticina]|nr:hypothetical protein PtB15_15B320 [Puccinia triticina]